MEYQDFLQTAGTANNIVSEHDFANLIQPVIADRHDLFPTDAAAIAYYNALGLKGFSDDFIYTFDDIVEGLERAKRFTGVDRTHFLMLVNLAVDQI